MRMENADDEILVIGNELTIFSSVTVLLVNSSGYFIEFRLKEVQIFFLFNHKPDPNFLSRLNKKKKHSSGGGYSYATRRLDSFLFPLLHAGPGIFDTVYS